ncbi:MAG: glycosyltransferase family 4 protein [Candidatus Pacebacteria bacterium]|jgi:glycosyltransferase involved in cell wall biosynthesis|nr:glycosyltransferase family 4 protein [Candidatus Paceibacterota bacterium]MBT4004750.1 glycosyltransferase family 4 protein [Candidatus Paceibacterota bacterium]MBT6899259.1 glycosyltransferase family 4 protein [Candidatus Paceibacterota bacterium]MBT7184159.1 glycosyltransferase family 4 protein [Candidatus Paceibacterota bacterium]MBT7310009.1 glycosyltransferase family 4 protein [Candidatus Paceibacterota bacterium]
MKFKNSVAIITQEFPLYSNKGGIATFFGELSDILSKNNHVFVVTKGPNKHKKNKLLNKYKEIIFPANKFRGKLTNFIFFRSPISLFFLLIKKFIPDTWEKIEWSFFACYWLKKIAPDIQIIHSCEYDFPYICARLFFPRVKIIIHSESPQLFLYKYVEYRWENLLKARIELIGAQLFSNLIIACSSQLFEFWKKKGVRHIIMKPNFINTTFWNKTSQNHFFAKKNANVNIVFIGRLEYRKGVDRLLRIYTEYRKKYGETISLHLIGKKTKTFPFKSSIIDFDSFVKKYNIDPSFICVGQINNKRTLKNYLSNLDGKVIYMHLARYEPNSLAIIEAMAFKLPILTTKEAGIDLIEDGKTGYFCPKSIKKAVEKLHQIIINWDYSKKAGENAQKYANSNLSKNNNLAFYKKIYNDLKI